MFRFLYICLEMSSLIQRMWPLYNNSLEPQPGQLKSCCLQYVTYVLGYILVI